MSKDMRKDDNNDPAIFRVRLTAGFALAAWVSFGLLLDPGCSHRPTPAEPKTKVQPKRSELPAPVPGWAKVYVGPNGVRVEMVRLEDETYLVRLTGTTSVIDGKVLRCKLVRDGVSRQRWVYQYDGEPHPIMTRQRRSTGTFRFSLYTPDLPDIGGLALEYDETESRKLEIKALVDRHLAQKERGQLAKLSRFDEKKAIQNVEARLAKRLASLNRKCHTSARLTVDWKSVGPLTPKSVQIASECGVGLKALANLCRAPGAPDAVAGRLDMVTCKIGAAPSFALEGKNLVWTVPQNFHYLIGSMRAKLANTIRWGDAGTLAQVIYDHRIVLWSNGQGLYLGLKPARPRDKMGTSMFTRRRMFYGTKNDGMRLVPKEHMWSNNSFFDPRYANKENHRMFRGRDLAYYVYVTFSNGTKHARFKCGYRKVDLEPVPLEKALSVLKGVKWLPELPRRRPYGLARDRRGIYYYVDRAPGTEQRDFRLYRGPLGKMVRLKMTNVVTDSEGDVFTTPSGNLRLVLEKEHSYWIRRGRKQRLINVPINKNLKLIYSDLGVYDGKPFGTPCDIF